MSPTSGHFACRENGPPYRHSRERYAPRSHYTSNRGNRGARHDGVSKMPQQCVSLFIQQHNMFLTNLDLSSHDRKYDHFHRDRSYYEDRRPNNCSYLREEAYPSPPLIAAPPKPEPEPDRFFCYSGKAWLQQEVDEIGRHL